MKRGYWIAKIAVLVVIALVAFTFITMWLWNWLVPDLFNGPVLDFWQTLGLLVLSKILFSGFGKKGGHSHGPMKGYWKHKLERMSPEERERFKQKMKDKWCYKVPDDSTPASDTSNG